MGAIAPGARLQRVQQLRHGSTGAVAVIQCFRGRNLSFRHLCWGSEQISIPMHPGSATALQISERSCCDTALPRVGRDSLNLSSRFGRIRCSAVATVAPEARDDYTQGAGSCYLGWQIYEDG